ncbi:CMRF35-like molecule 7 isoform X2 [Ailuropoda melanoleuca]|uniref:CMRF35-like molecule 7 isoform X2 n=1 Tax=Ailuropoda melanoleuca TaxID=9646 RepID=UPI001494DAFB|nr:CMRF35-like molecule 7 isoform X2 [Ailuropoda melanoleuca]
MWLLPVLFLLIVQGHFSICQEGLVRGTEGGTLTAYCEYTPGWESYKKWWCRGKNWISCRILVKTNGTDELVKKDRASIQDNSNRRTFTMILEKLRRDDADTYWCGIERTGVDPVYKLSVIVDPAPVLAGSPKPVPGPTPASWDSSFPLTQGITSNQPVTLINPISRSGALASMVAAKKPPAWIVLVPLFLVTLQWLCRG